MTYIRTLLDSLLGRWATRAPRRAVILIADGNPSTIPEMDRLLKNAGYAVTRASDVPSALQASHRHKPRAVLLGQELPGGGSVAAAQKLRASEITTNIPIITVANPGEQRQALLRCGVDRCLDPPARSGAILVALETLLD